MSKNKAARRAQKKHQKEKKRQAKRAGSSSRAEEAARDPYLGWRAENHPVRALLSRGMGPALAQRYAEQYQAEFGVFGLLHATSVGQACHALDPARRGLPKEGLIHSNSREKRKTRQAPARRKRDLPGSHSPWTELGV